MASAATDARGAFSWPRISPGTYRLKASASGRRDAQQSVDIAAAANQHLVIHLDRAVVLAGRIQDARRAPVPLAHVLAYPATGSQATSVGETHADEEGRFRIDNASPGLYRLLIDAPGLGSSVAGPFNAPDQDVVVVLAGQSRSIAGHVVRDGQPAVGARVVLAGEALAEARTTQSNTEGRFAFGGLGPGRYSVRADSDGYASAVRVDVLLADKGSTVSPIELALRPALIVKARVTDDSGHALPDANVELDSVPASGLWPSTPTDQAGNWSSPPLPPGNFRLRARRAGYVGRQAASVTIGAAGAAPNTSGAVAATLTLEMIRTGRVEGRVLDDRGAALVGATVYDRLAEVEELGVIWAPLPPAAEAAARPVGIGATVSSGNARRATTDGKGLFEIEDVPPGRLRIEVVHPGSVPIRSGPLVLSPGQVLNLGVLRAPAATRVSGRVLDATGHPIGGARVSATIIAGRGDVNAPGGDALFAVSDAGGDFVLPLGAGTHRLTASAVGHTEASATVSLTGRGDAPPPVTFRIAKREVTVEGMVRDGEGRPLARATVSARVADTAAGGGDFASDAQLAQGPLGTATSDAGGHFRLAGLPAGPLQIEVRHPSYAAYRKTITPTGLVTISVPVPGGIDGEVRDKSTGAPVTTFELRGHGPDGATIAVTSGRPGRSLKKKPSGWATSSDSRISIRQVQPGTWTLRVTADGYQPLDRVIEVPSASFPGEPSVRDLRLELTRDTR